MLLLYSLLHTLTLALVSNAETIWTPAGEEASCPKKYFVKKHFVLRIYKKIFCQKAFCSQDMNLKDGHTWS